MATAPAHDQRRLLDLQALDTRLDQIAHQRAKHPTLARLVELDSQLADLTTTLVASRTAASRACARWISAALRCAATRN